MITAPCKDVRMQNMFKKVSRCSSPLAVILTHMEQIVEVVNPTDWITMLWGATTIMASVKAGFSKIH